MSIDEITNSINDLNTVNIEDGSAGTLYLEDGTDHTVITTDTVNEAELTVNEVWTNTDHTNSIEGLCVDSSSNIYTASWDNYIRKINSSGSIVWSKIYGSNRAYGLTIDSNCIYAVGWNSKFVIRYDFNGNLLSSICRHTSTIVDVHLGTDGYIYTCDNSYVIKTDKNGNQIWSNYVTNSGGQSVWSVISDNVGNVYAGIWNSNGGGINKIDSSGTVHYNYIPKTIGNIYKMIVDSDNNLYAVGQRGDSNLHKYNQNGTEIWKVYTGDVRKSFHFDNSEYIYVASGTELSRFTLDGDIDVNTYILKSDYESPFNMTIDSNGYVYIGNTKLTKFSKDITRNSYHLAYYKISDDESYIPTKTVECTVSRSNNYMIYYIDGRNLRRQNSSLSTSFQVRNNSMIFITSSSTITLTGNYKTINTVSGSYGLYYVYGDFTLT